MPDPITQFRVFDITGAEPTDRATQGTAIDNLTSFLDFLIANITSGNSQVGPLCIVYRSSNLNGNTEINNMKFGITANSALNNNAKYYCDITNDWTVNKTIENVINGSPGVCPSGFPSSENLFKNGGGVIAGIDHANTSQYIYLVIDVDSNDAVGEDKGGAEGSLSYGVQADYL